MEISKERVRNPGEVDDEYMCPICIHLLWKPVECQHCQRIFCKQCIDRCLKEKPSVCPLCKQYQEKRCSPMFYALLCKFKIECENKQNGCNEVLLYESLEKHQEEQCQYQMKTCHGCQKNILKKDLHQHEQKCGEIKIECKRCHLIYKQKEKHEQLDCIMNMLDQSNKKVESLEKVVQNLQSNLQKVESLEKAVQNLQSNLQNQKVESLEKIVQNLQPNLQKVERTVSLILLEDLASGVVHDIPISSLSMSWNIIYDFPYNHVTTVEELRALKSQCKQRIIVGAIQGKSSTILKIAAMGPSEILSLVSPLNQPTKYGNVHWYLTPRYAFGFAPSTTTIRCCLADVGVADNSENRLSWSLWGSGGWRAGAANYLNQNSEWRKIIMTEKS